ncbi:MAG TPA: flagellar assembly protein FliW [Tepidisphaeraceae bacterium]
MEIVTSRFGTLEVEDERIVTFTKGLLGFPGRSRFALIQTNEENYFFWLQSLEEPGLAFVVTDPSTFFKEYEVPLREETQLEIELEDVASTQVLVICNKIGDWLTGNLLGPLVLNVANQLATQVVLTDKKWTTRQPLLRLGHEQLAKAG